MVRAAVCSFRQTRCQEAGARRRVPGGRASKKVVLCAGLRSHFFYGFNKEVPDPAWCLFSAPGTTLALFDEDGSNSFLTHEVVKA